MVNTNWICMDCSILSNPNWSANNCSHCSNNILQHETNTSTYINPTIIEDLKEAIEYLNKHFIEKDHVLAEKQTWEYIKQCLLNQHLNDYIIAQNIWNEYISTYPKGTTISFNEYCKKQSEIL